jgi:HSP20 family protein
VRRLKEDLMEPRSQRHPWQEMRRLQHQMEHLYAGLTPALRSSLTGEYPPINFTRKDNGLTLEAMCPGVDRNTLDVTVVGDVVTVRGQRTPEADAAQASYYRRERPSGAFARSIVLNERLNADGADATYRNGILRVQLSRAPEASPRKIAIKS